MREADTPIKERAEARIGMVLREKWHLDELLGLGGMAAVYAATHRNGKRAAIKILHPEAALIPDVKARFLREGYLANKVGHWGAVSILDDDVDADGNVYLVMELLEGETLEQRWQHDDRLGWSEALIVADQVLDVLITAHAKHIVHRDLKPGNVFIHADGSVKLLDFGIARLGSLQTSKHDTGPHVSLGTPGFMPPEQARGRSADVDAQSDLWALGATLFAVLSGRHVHEADTANEQLLEAMTKPAPALASVAPEVPPRVAEIVDRALRFEKSERWPDALTMQTAVREVYEALTGASLQGGGRLSVPVLRASRSVQPDAPTLAAEMSLDDRLTTNRPVSDRSSVSIAAAPPRRGRIALAAIAAAALAALAAVVLMRSEPAPEASPAAAPSAPEPAPEPAPPPVPAATSEPDPRPEPPASASASASAPPPASASPQPKPRPWRPKPAPRPAAKPPPAPPATVDIFTRRK